MVALKRENDADLAQARAYEIEFILNTDKIVGLDSSDNPLRWRSIPFSPDQRHKLLEKRGIYAFVIADRRRFLPSHGYIMYIGISGANSNRSLRERYTDYFKNSEVRRRPHIRHMIVQWLPILHFHFAPVADQVSPAQLKAIESRLITAFLPPCCKDDIEAGTRRAVAAFKR